jgi:sigma-B regulation protein RsbU (phosphoserine phosphatase)
MYGKDRLKAIVKKNASSGSQTILSTIFQDLNQFRGEVKQEDDVTLVVIKLDPASE